MNIQNLEITSCSFGVTFIELRGVIKFKSSPWLTVGNLLAFPLDVALALSTASIILILGRVKKKRWKQMLCAAQYQFDSICSLNKIHLDCGIQFTTEFLLMLTFLCQHPLQSIHRMENCFCTDSRALVLEH